MVKYLRVTPGLIVFVLLAGMFIEIAGFIIVGKIIGVMATIILLLISMIAGLSLLRREGLSFFKNVQREVAAGHAPAQEVLAGSLSLAAALLLIIPGFVTDIIGLLLFVPIIRDTLSKFFLRRLTPGFSYSNEQNKPSKGPVIDLNSEDYHRNDRKPSPWHIDNDRD